MIKAAVIGCGDISTVHLSAIGAIVGAELVAVVDTDPAARSAAAEKWDVRGYPDHRVMLDELRPDVVHVCTPHDQHVDPAVDCLRAGVPVLAEKPVAATMPEAQRLIDAAAAHPNTKIGICLQNRYNATAQAMRSMIDSGELGRVLGGNGTVLWHRTQSYYEAKPWRGRRDQAGGGALINQAIHTLDLLQWMVGPVVAVDGRADHYGPTDTDVEDTAQLALTHRGGAQSVFFASNLNPIDTPVTLQIVTERAVLDLRGDLTVAYDDGRLEVVEERRASSVGRSYWGVSHELLIADFYAKLLDPEPFWIGPTEAAASLDIICRLYALSGR